MAPYESRITFTLDTICPWTYLAKKRLDEALRRLGESGVSDKVNFTVTFLPYQLYPDAPLAGEDKYAWYRRSRYGDSEEKMDMYVTLMTAYGASANIAFKFHGLTANTLPAHHLIHYTQSRQPTKTSALIDALYRLYFEQEHHPSSSATLVAAAQEAGLGAQGEELARVIGYSDVVGTEVDVSKLDDWSIEGGERDTKIAIREQAMNGVDSVPLVLVEGRRRDLTLIGAKEVEEYEKALRQVLKESS